MLHTERVQALLLVNLPSELLLISTFVYLINTAPHLRYDLSSLIKKRSHFHRFLVRKWYVKYEQFLGKN